MFDICSTSFLHISIDPTPCHWKSLWRSKSGKYWPPCYYTYLIHLLQFVAKSLWSHTVVAPCAASALLKPLQLCVLITPDLLSSYCWCPSNLLCAIVITALPLQPLQWWVQILISLWIWTRKYHGLETLSWSLSLARLHLHSTSGQFALPPFDGNLLIEFLSGWSCTCYLQLANSHCCMHTNFLELQLETRSLWSTMSLQLSLELLIATSSTLSLKHWLCLANIVILLLFFYLGSCSKGNDPCE